MAAVWEALAAARAREVLDTPEVPVEIGLAESPAEGVVQAERREAEAPEMTGAVAAPAALATRRAATAATVTTRQVTEPTTAVAAAARKE